MFLYLETAGTHEGEYMLLESVRSVPPCWERGGMNYSGGARCHVDRVVRGHAATCRPGGVTLSNGF